MELFFGIDVGKFVLDVNVRPFNESFNVNNDKAGLRELIKKIKVYLNDGHCMKLTVCEATGGYEKLLVSVLHFQQLPVHVAHANKVRNFAKATGKFAKTDKLDASILSDYAMVFKPKADECKINDELKVLKDLQTRRRQLQDDLIKENNRLDKNISPGLIKSIRKHIRWLESAIKSVDKATTKFIEDHDNIKTQIELLTSIPGIGQNTASAILTDLPEINTVDGKQLSALAGVAPMNRDSGTKSGRRYISGGRANIRTVLYMATIASIRCNKLIQTFYKRLRDKGKPAKVAIVAAMHKLLLVIKSVINRQSI